MNDAYLPLSNEDGGITFLVGENGTGKSTELRNLAVRFTDEGSTVVAISGSVFDKFPSMRNAKYHRLSPSTGRQYVANAFKAAISGQGIREEPRSARLLGRILSYAGFLPVLGYDVKVGRSWTPASAHSALASLDEVEEIDRMLLRSVVDGIASRDRYGDTNILDLGSSGHSNISLELSALLRYERLLRRTKIVNGVILKLAKNNQFFDLAKASSGELTLLAIYAFLAPRMTERIVILIDEPENSLHPRWQSEYCKQFFDLFHLYGPKLFIASHSPIIVSGAEAHGIPSRTIVLPRHRTANSDIQSIDGILMEAFGVLAPASHYLSEMVASMLNDLMLRKSTLGQVRQELLRLRDLSYESKQKDFLTRALDLASDVAEESRKTGGTNAA